MATQRVLGYIRVSTQEQAEHGLGLPVQEQAIVDYCRAKGYELVGMHRDPGVSGTLPWYERPGLTDALAAVKEREHDPLPIVALIVPRWDRLARDTLEALVAEREFMRHGAPVESADGMNGDQTMRELMHVMASAERRALVARLTAGRKSKAAQGGYTGGRPKIGWRAEGKALVIDEPAAKIVRGIFMHIARGWSVRRVAKFLDDRRALGRTWDARRVHRIVTDPRYKSGGAGKAIVDPRIWNQANAALAARRTRRDQAPAAA